MDGVDESVTSFLSDVSNVFMTQSDECLALSKRAFMEASNANNVAQRKFWLSLSQEMKNHALKGVDVSLRILKRKPLTSVT